MRFFLQEKAKWKNQKSEISKLITNCSHCNIFDKKKINFEKIRLELKDPFFRMGIEVIGPLPRSDLGYKYLLLATDHTSRWAKVRPVENKNKETVAKFLFEEVFMRHDPSKELISDQGLKFCNELVREICRKLSTKHVSTSSYNPKCNGATERFNKTFLNKFVKIVYEDLDNWCEYVNYVRYIYYTTPIARIEASPFKIIFGKKPHMCSLEEILPDVQRDVNVQELDKIRSYYIEKSKTARRMDIQINSSGKSTEDLRVNELVRRRRPPQERSSKLDSEWLPEPFWVIEVKRKAAML